MRKENTPSSRSDRVLLTPSSYAQEHYLFIQETGTLTSLRPHVSKRDYLKSFLFLIVRQGEGTITSQEIQTTLTAGDCAFIDCSKGYYHESSTNNPWTLQWVHFYGKSANELYKQYLTGGCSTCFHPENVAEFIHILDSIYHLQQEPNQFSELYTHAELTRLLALSITENTRLLSADGSIGSSLIEKLDSLRQYISEHCYENLSLDRLAEQFYISKYHLAREYHREFGVTIGNDITMKRISGAKSLLRFSTDTIENIASSCGFSDAGYFTKVFKLYENMTPREYRNQWL